MRKQDCIASIVSCSPLVCLPLFPQTHILLKEGRAVVGSDSMFFTAYSGSWSSVCSTPEGGLREGGKVGLVVMVYRWKMMVMSGISGSSVMTIYTSTFRVHA